MGRFFSLIAAPLFILSLLATPAQGLARDRPNLIIIGEDFDLGTLPRGTQIYRGILETLSNRLHQAGFSVYDETSITLDGFTQGRSRRSEAEVVDIARSVTRPPLDIAVFFSLYTYAETFTYTKKVTSRLTARILDIRSGRQLGSFELDAPRQLRLPLHCDRSCTLARLDQTARALSGDLSSALVVRLETAAAGGAVAPRPPGAEGALAATGFRLVFQDFSDQEVADIEEYLVVFRGYRLHRPIETGSGRHEYWYESTSPRARLNRNLTKMLHHIRIGGQVDFSDDTFTVTRLADPQGESKPWDAW